MYKFGRRHILVLAFSSSVSLLCLTAAGATPAIGVATSSGRMIVDSGETPGNATIFDGSTLQTEKSISHARMKDGARVWIAADSRGKFFADHFDLQQGSASFSGYQATANGLSIRTEGAEGRAVVSLHGKAIEVASLSGGVHVFNAQGVNVANLVPGKALNLTPQDAGASAPSSLTGCPVRTSSGIIMTDEGSDVTVQLRGGKITPRKRVTITGSMAANATPVRPATQVIDVASVKEIGGACKQGTASAAAAGGAAGAAGATGAAGAGISATTAVIGGVAAAAAVGTAIAVSVTNGASTGIAAGSSTETVFLVTVITANGPVTTVFAPDAAGCIVGLPCVTNTQAVAAIAATCSTSPESGLGAIGSSACQVSTPGH
jgi:hypothetical protein